jgi:chemotaxis protein MotB
MNLDYLKSILTNNLKNDPILSDVVMRQEADRLILSLPGDVLFLPGQSTLTDQARRALFELGGTLRNIGNRVGVQGHSDPVPLSGTGRFTSNWELSLARAISVSNSMKQAGYTKDITVYGFADSRFERISTTLPQQVRFARARRVDVVIQPDAGAGFGDF